MVVVPLQWPGRELNPRHADFQSAALPTELPGRYYTGSHRLTTRSKRRGWQCNSGRLALVPLDLPLAPVQVMRCTGISQVCQSQTTLARPPIRHATNEQTPSRSRRRLRCKKTRWRLRLLRHRHRLHYPLGYPRAVRNLPVTAGQLFDPCAAVITDLIPPRRLKSPTTRIHFGFTAATRSSRIRFTARS